jgi:hypothetical protein
MTAAIETEGRGVLSIRITGVASAADAGQGAIENPEGDDVLILRTTLVVLAPSTGAANISIGIGATSGTAATDIVNALAMNGVAANTAYNGHAMQNTAKTAITAPALWTPTSYLTITGSASLVGLDARLLVEYVRIN